MANIKPFPIAPKLKYLIGPSFILLGLGLGSGEVILWPFLSANYGLGIIWASVLGITFQFFMNMEIERYSLVKGESIFAGFARKYKKAPFWFILSTFIGFGWPGMAAASAVMIGSVFGVEKTEYIAISLLFITGLLFTLGPVLYKVVERFQKTIITIAVPFIFFLVLRLATFDDWMALGRGVIGSGDGYWFFPEGIAVAVFLSAFAYAGAGGNLNLSQSFYVKDKGYGMGKYASKISSPITGKSASVSVYSETVFKDNAENYNRFKDWWRKVNIEHGIVFLGTGAFTMLMLALLAYSAVYGHPGVSTGIDFILYEAEAIAAIAGKFISVLFLMVGGITLLATQIVVFESSSRIVSENIALIREKAGKSYSVSKTFYFTLWLLIIFGSMVLLSGFNEPRALLVLGAVINAFAMLVHLIMTYFLNRSSLPKLYRTPVWRQWIIWLEIVFFAVFSVIVFWDQLISRI